MSNYLSNKPLKRHKQKKPLKARRNGAHNRNWTDDLTLTKGVLYRLSYEGAIHSRFRSGGRWRIRTSVGKIPLINSQSLEPLSKLRITNLIQRSSSTLCAPYSATSKRGLGQQQVCVLLVLNVYSLSYRQSPLKVHWDNRNNVHSSECANILYTPEPHG